MRKDAQIHMYFFKKQESWDMLSISGKFPNRPVTYYFFIVDSSYKGQDLSISRLFTGMGTLS